MGNQCLKVQKTNSTDRLFYNQLTTSLQKGSTYTLSAYVNTSGVSSATGAGAGIFVNYYNSLGILVTVDSKYINGTNDWQRSEVTFTLPSDAANTNVYIRAGIIGESGTAYFDCLQLEDGSLANRYNLVENPDFRNGSFAFWNKNIYCDSNDVMTTNSSNYSSANIDSNCFKINGKPSLNKNIYQTINVSGKAGDIYVLSGWGKADSVPLSSGRYFGLDIEIKGTSGSNNYIVIPFNEDSSEWQYASNVIKMDRDYSSLTVYGIYYGNANSAYFDGFRLYKEEFGDSYTYDSNGNLTSTAALANQNSSFTYNTKNDLITATDPKGNQFKYDYDANHNMKTATTAENVVYSFTYDSSGNPLTSKVGDSSLFINSSATYTSSGNYLNTITNSSGNTTTNSWNEQKGVLNNVTDAKGYKTSYTYDSNTDKLTNVSKVANGVTVSNSYGYQNDRISTITQNGFNYSFGYDSLGNNKTVSIGSQNLITNNYETTTGKLLSSTYGNGQQVSSDYDSLDRIVGKKYNGTSRYTYQFDASGNIGFQNDIINGTSYRYIYDIANRPVQIKDSKGNLISYTYDSNNNKNKISDKINGTTYDTSYDYNKDNKQKTITYNRATANSISFAYDALGRNTTKSVSTGSATYNTVFGYLAGANGSTTTRVGSITNNGVAISYTYDVNSNIDTITQNGSKIKYYYDELNELIREDNAVLNKTIVYAYDAGGNLTSKTEYPYTTGTVGTATKTYAYAYGDTNWKDKLTSFDGKSITYDAIGNPLSYNGWSYTWEEGRQLSAISGNSNTISYKYNDAGIRTAKTVNGVTTSYHLVGDKVTYETNGTDNIYYTYDSNDNLVSMSLNGVEYYYIRNGQGDIIGLFDKTGTQVVSYTYDTWGKLISITGSLASTVGAKNPYRYRGYRYDAETGLYYLNSRYYSPDWGRFINADGIVGQTGELLGHNLFGYCKNNPVNMQDNNGFRPDFSGTGHDRGDDAEVSFAIMNNRYNYDTGTITNTGSSSSSSRSSSGSSDRFNYVESSLTNGSSGGLDMIAGKVATKTIVERQVYQECGMGLGHYVSSLSRHAVFGKKLLGYAGTIGFTVWDAGKCLRKGDYKGAGIALVKAGAGVLVGGAIGIGVAVLLPEAVPVGVVIGIELVANVAVGMYLDNKIR